MALPVIGPYATYLRIGAVRVVPTWGRLRDLSGWPGLGLSLGIRLFEGLRNWMAGAYSHLFWWEGTDIWEAGPSGVRKGCITEYRDRSDVVHAYALPGLTAAGDGRLVRWLDDLAISMPPYDFPQFFKIAIAQAWSPAVASRIPDGGEAAYICSELISVGAKREGIDLCSAAGCPAWAFMPGHLNVLRFTHPELVQRVGILAFDDPSHEV